MDAVTHYSYTEKELKEVEKALGIVFSPRDKYLLQTDRYSELIEGIEDPTDKTVRRGAKFHLYRNSKNEVAVNIFYKKEALVIPDYIGKRKLSTDDKQQLMLGNVIQIKDNKNQNLYIQIDKELNAIIVKGDRELGIPNIIGANDKFKFDGCSLGDDDKLKLANGGILEPRVMCGDEGFFLARLGMTDDKKGYIIIDYQTIPQEKVQEYINKYNKSQELLDNHPLTRDTTINVLFSETEILTKIQDKDFSFGDLSHVFDTPDKQNNFLQKYGIKEHYTQWVELSEAYDLNFRADNNSAMEKLDKQMQALINEVKDIVSLKVQELGIQLDYKVNRDFDREFAAALDNHDFEKLDHLSNEGYKLADHQISQIETMRGLSDNDKIAVKTIFKVHEDAPTLKEENKKRGDKSPEIKRGEEKTNLIQQTKEAGKTDSRKIEKIGNVMNQAFQQM